MYHKNQKNFSFFSKDSLNSTYKLNGKTKLWFIICTILSGLSLLEVLLSVLVVPLGRMLISPSIYLPAIFFHAAFPFMLSLPLNLCLATIFLFYLALLLVRKKVLFLYNGIAHILFFIILLFVVALEYEVDLGLIVFWILPSFFVLVIGYFLLRTCNETEDNLNAVNEEGSDKIFCPKCGGNSLQAINEVSTSGGGYGTAKGCCGYILLGPLGLLCGACGNKTKTKNKTYFICSDCGNKFAK